MGNLFSENSLAQKILLNYHIPHKFTNYLAIYLKNYEISGVCN
jgi:hypothetical protein